MNHKNVLEQMISKEDFEKYFKGKRFIKKKEYEKYILSKTKLLKSR